MELVSALMPVFNRYPNLRWLVEESVHSFLQQDYENRELIILNDTPEQILQFAHPRVKVWNLKERMPNLSAKIQFMIDHSEGSILCRWDDDDISLPHRLSYSVKKLADNLEWRPENYWYWNLDKLDPLQWVGYPGNTHTMAVWRREVLKVFGGGYPGPCSGQEDQLFNRTLGIKGVNSSGEIIPDQDIFYIYRWQGGIPNLSCRPAINGSHQDHWDELGTTARARGVYPIVPQWLEDYRRKASYACAKRRSAG